MTGAFAGTPALIVPTMAERESNARRLAALGVTVVVFDQQATTPADGDYLTVMSANARAFADALTN